IGCMHGERGEGGQTVVVQYLSYHRWASHEGDIPLGTRVCEAPTREGGQDAAMAVSSRLGPGGHAGHPRCPCGGGSAVKSIALLANTSLRGHRAHRGAHLECRSAWPVSARRGA